LNEIGKIINKGITDRVAAVAMKAKMMIDDVWLAGW
jgi:hypothetical protein